MKKDDSEQNTVVYWLKKIYEKMDSIECKLSENNEEMKAQSRRLDSVFSEMGKINDRLNKEVPDMRVGGKILHDKNHYGNSSVAREIRKVVNRRKLSYYNKIRTNGIAGVYKEFLKRDPPFIPNKFRERYTETETEQQKSRRQKLEIIKLEFEMERLEELAVKHDGELEEAELDVKEQLSSVDEPSERQDLKQYWYSQIKVEEERSNDIWEKKRQFFVELPNKSMKDNENEPSGSKPKQFVRNKFQLNKQNDHDGHNYHNTLNKRNISNNYNNRNFHPRYSFRKNR